MNILFFGTDDFVVPVLHALHDNFRVVGVVTVPDFPRGRKKILTPTPIKMAAETVGIPVFTPDKSLIANNETAKDIDLPEADVYVVASYGKIIAETILNRPRLGGVNIHPSHLPKYRGPSPIPYTILNGDTDTAVTIIQMDDQLDHGPILSIKPTSVSQKDTFESLAHKLFQFGAEILPDVLRRYASGDLKPEVQDEKKATFTKHITKENGYIDLSHPPSKAQIERMIRAYYPWPGVWTRWVGKIVKFYPTGKIQMEGKNIVSVNDFLNGYPDSKEMITNLITLPHDQ